MSGHNKWSSIKHKKQAADAKRGKLFTKLIKEITLAAKLGGGNPENNIRLRHAIEKAKANNMPKDNIEKAIKRGTGQLQGTKFENVIYEGFGPEGVAIIIEAFTDNKNRTSAQIKAAFKNSGGSLGGSGSVSWMFEKKGLIIFDKANIDTERLLDFALTLDIDDIEGEENSQDTIMIYTQPNKLNEVLTEFENNNFQPSSSELVFKPKTYKEISQESAQKVIKLLEKLEQTEDVESVYCNFKIKE